MTTATLMSETLAALYSTISTALSTTKVVDGPGAYNEGAEPVVVYIGTANPDAAEEHLSAISDQEWAWLGHVARRAEFTTFHCIDAWNGDADQAAARVAAQTALQAFTDAITADPTLGIAILATTGISNIQLDQWQDENGAHARITFGLRATALLQ